ncbi:DUF4179 domain-containing protein [Clostridium sp. AL.422]|uniref:DUF4179 domain-containing protein n=1 Tax=Clostridium TaxID=1485 RepID=UPI00293DCA36|nr:MULTISPECIES: DUF4179 domain-containing protein [unclassified Clostridium]MDV4152204.1 DUF4179 domain-containing protein [Clostridium sp. AL.422]
MNNYEKDKFNDSLKQEARNINIEVPDKLKNNILKTLDELPERGVKRKSKLRKISGLVAGIIVCMLTFNIFMPAYAESLPIIGPTFKSINEVIGIGDKYVEGAKDVNITQKYEDTTMTIKNIYYDGVELAIAYELKSEKGFDDKPIIFPIIKRGFKNIDYKNEENDGDFIDDNTYVGLASYAFTDNELADKAKIEFVVNDLYGEWVGYYPKKFKFKFSIDSKDMGKETYKVDKEIKYDDSIFKLTELITSNLNTIVYMDTDIGLVKPDENNSEIFIQKYTLKVLVQDDKGIPIDWKEGSGTGSNVKDERVQGNYLWRYKGVPEETKSITLIPVISESTYNRELMIEKINENSETVINMGNGQEYIIKNIEFKEDKTVIDLKIKKYIDSLEHIGIEIWDEDRVNKYKESNNGQEQNWYKDTIDIEIQETKFNGVDDGYNFTLILPALDKNKDYFITKMNTGDKILEDEKITIDLEK